MPRLPTEDSLGVSVARSNDVQAQRPGQLGRAIAGAGQVISDEADRNTAVTRQLALEDKQKTDALDLTRARADWTKRRLEEEDTYNLEKNPNYAGWEKTYNTNIEKHRQASANLISSPSLRARFEAETQDDVTRGSITIRNRAAGYDRELRTNQAVKGLDDAIDAAARPGIDPKDANKILGEARANIDNMQAAGLISPGKAVELRQGLAKRYAKIRVAQDIQDDPNSASLYLDGGGQGAVGLIRKREGYRARPYYDENAYRVGYGSDTVTLEDGTVLKVKPGMQITRADAERDLERRIGEFQSGIVRDVGPDKWGAMPPAAKAALTSVAYNYGSLPDSVVNAVKSGDLHQVAEAVRGLKGHNGGKNAGRRLEEASIIEGGGDVVAGLDAPEYYGVLSAEDRMSLQADATGEIAAREKQARESNSLERYQVRASMENDLTQITETGRPTDLNPQQVVDVLGEDDAAKFLEKRKQAADTYAATSVIDTMPGDQIEQHLEALQPKAGDPDFASKQAVYDAAEKKATKIQDLRVKDPAKAVEDSPQVREAMKNYDPAKPESSQALVRARIAAQTEVGIPPALQKPVTRKEAYAIIAPIQSIIDQADATTVMAVGKAKSSAERRAAIKAARQQTEDQLRATIDQVEQTFGPYAQDVLSFAIAESVRDKEIGDITARIYRKIAKGEAPSSADISALDHATEASQAEKAINGDLAPSPSSGNQGPAAAPAPAATTPAPPAGSPPAASPAAPAAPRTIAGAPNRAQVAPKAPPPAPAGGWPAPSNRAVSYLIQNPATAAQFDEIYGPGAADRWRPAPQE